MNDIFVPLVLTALAGAWRYADGRGKPWRETAIRNLVGVAVALACAGVGVNSATLAPLDPWWWAGLACGGLAALTLIAGTTKWESLSFSLGRYGGPTAVIGALAFMVGAPVVPCVLYAAGGSLVAVVYATLHNLQPGRTYWLTQLTEAHRFARANATKISEAVAGAVLIGGLSWL